MPFSRAAKYTIGVWAFVMPFYGWYSVAKTMKVLEVAPSPDLYANGLGFQVAVFLLTKGLGSVVVLVIALLIEASFLVKREPGNE